MMRQDFKEQSDNAKWFDLWVAPLLSSDLSPPLEQLLTSVVNIDTSVIQYIVK